MIRLVQKARGRNQMRCFRLETKARWLLLVALLWACSSCSMFKKSPQAADRSMETNRVTAVGETTDSNENLPFFHQVRWEGETLSIIAKWYTGDSRNWKALAKVNPWLKPDNMFVGLKVKIPRQLLQNKKRMPREFVLSSTSKNKGTSKTIEVSEKEASGSSTGAGTAKGAYMQYVGP
jgi:hypothetical protein